MEGHSSRIRRRNSKVRAMKINSTSPNIIFKQRLLRSLGLREDFRSVLGLVFAGMHDMKRNVQEKRIGEPILKVSLIITI